MTSLNEMLENARIYASTISRVSEEELERLQKQNLRQELGVETFLRDMLLAKEDDRRNIARWSIGTTIPIASAEQRQQIFSPNFPQHVWITEDALGLIRFGIERRYEAIDGISNEICTAVARRLPRTLDGYRYIDNHAHDELEVPNIGRMKVTLHDNHGIFRYVCTVESSVVRIWNSRPTGRQYMNRYNDTSFPQDITIPPLDLELKLYSDDSGIFLTEKGIEFTNSRTRALGIGYKGDGKRDEMYRIGRKEKIPFFGEDTRTKLDAITPDKNWIAESRKIVSWLRKNVLDNILMLPENPNRIGESPQGVPFPQDLGELYTWLNITDSVKLLLTRYDPSRVYPHERVAVSPEWRLVPLGTSGNYPREANRGFIYCALGEVDRIKSPEESVRGFRAHWDDSYVLSRVKPKDGEEIFVVDYQVWDDFREQVFTDSSKQRMSDHEYNEMHTRLANTLIPITQYDGTYRKPTVLIGKELRFDEIEVIPGVEYTPKR